MIIFNFTQLFWYKLLFITELLVCEILFVAKLNRKKHFFLRAAGCLAAIYIITFFFPILFYNAVYLSFLFLALFGSTLIALKICFDAGWWNIFFCSIAAFTVKHIAYLLYSMTVDIFSLDKLFSKGGIFDPYGTETYGFNVFSEPLSVVAYFNIYFLVYWAGYFVCGRRVQPDGDLRLGRKNLVILSGVIVLSNVVFNIITIYNSGGNQVSLRLERLYNLLTCMLAMYLQFSQLYQKEIKSELATVNQLLYAQNKQYELSKQNMEYINIKCHDLKHQLWSLRERNMPLERTEIEEIEKAVGIYDAPVKTGNEALDIILTEKRLFCGKNKIVLSCIADGRKLDFMRASDIYALFGNALDNAVEAVMKLEESKRNISLIIKSVGNIVSVHLENCFNGQIALEQSIPKTTKNDPANHGFGMLSMKTIVEKYGGTMAVDLLKNTFNLNIIFTNHTADP